MPVQMSMHMPVHVGAHAYGHVRAHVYTQGMKSSRSLSNRWITACKLRCGTKMSTKKTTSWAKCDLGPYQIYASTMARSCGVVSLLDVRYCQHTRNHSRCTMSSASAKGGHHCSMSSASAQAVQHHAMSSVCIRPRHRV